MRSHAAATAALAALLGLTGCGASEPDPSGEKVINTAPGLALTSTGLIGDYCATEAPADGDVFWLEIKATALDDLESVTFSLPGARGISLDEAPILVGKKVYFEDPEDRSILVGWAERDSYADGAVMPVNAFKKAIPAEEWAATNGEARYAAFRLHLDDDVATGEQRGKVSTVRADYTRTDGSEQSVSLDVDLRFKVGRC